MAYKLLGDSMASEVYMAYKLQMPVNHPEESIQHSEHGRSFKSRMVR
jgi:hypothetical protein